MKSPLVTVIIPTRNRLSLLTRAVASVRRITELPVELIVVDGRSSDGTERWLRKQHDIAVIPELEPQGFVKAVNLGFRCAAGKYISWLNDDAEYFDNVRL